MNRREFARLCGGIGAGLGVCAGIATGDGHGGGSVTVHTVEVESWDGTTLVADLYDPPSGGARPAVVYGHGSAGNRESVADRAAAVARAGYVVLAPDFRGFNDSGGESTINGPTEVADFFVLFDRLAGGTFDRYESEGTVEVRVRGAPGDPLMGMRGDSLGAAMSLLVAAADRQWFERLDDLEIEFDEGLVGDLPDDVDLPQVEADTPLTFVDEAPDPDVVEAAMSTLSLESTPVDVVAPRIPWQDLQQVLVPNGVVKGAWFAFLNVPAFEVPEGVPSLWRLMATAYLAARNEAPEPARRFFQRRTPDLESIADHGVPTLVLEEWNDGYLPPSQGLRIVDGIREAGGGSPPVAITLSPMDGRPTGGEPAHNWSYPWEEVDPAIETYLEEATMEWLESYLVGGRPDLPTVSQYQRQRGSWRALDRFPPEAATVTELDLASATLTDSTVVANTVAPTSARGPTGTLFASPHADAPASSAVFDFVATEDGVDVATFPRFRLALTPLGDDAFVFAKFELVPSGEATGPVIDSQVKPYRIREAAGERTTVAFDLDPFQRYLDTGDRLRLVLSSTDNGFFNSREAAGVVVHHADPGESAATVHTVADGEAPLEGRSVVDR